VRNGTEESVILDCDYSIEDHEKKGLVVKWYFTNKQTQVYQWIPNSKPISLGILKGKLNLDYQADGDDYKARRALQINRPTTELSGKNTTSKYLLIAYSLKNIINQCHFHHPFR